MKFKYVYFLILLLLLPCGNLLRAQGDYSGFWYMRNAKNGGQYYLVPAANPQQNPPVDVYFDAYGANPAEPYSKPFLTTYQTGGDDNSVWLVTPVTGESGYYHIKHCQSGKYAVYGVVLPSKAETNFVHLEDNPDLTADNTKFALAAYRTSYVGIRPKSAPTLYWNVSVSNENNYYGIYNSPGYRKGLVGGYNSTTDEGSSWTFDKAYPTVALNASDEAEISFPIPTVALYYTIGAYDDITSEPADPTTSDNLYTVPITLTAGKRNVIKVIAAETVDGETGTSIVVKKVIDLRADAAADYSGYCYLQNQGNTQYNMYPSNGNENATVKTDKKTDFAAVWQIVRQPGTGAHNIIHFSDGRYLTAVDATALTNTVTLTTLTAGFSDPADAQYLFVIEENGTGVYNIKPILAANADDKNYLNVTGGNGSNHTLGLNTASENNSKWVKLTVPAAPSIAVSDINVTFTPPFGDVKYKIDNLDYAGDDATNPSATSGTQGTNCTLKYGPTYTVRAVSIYQYDGANYWVSEVATRDVQVALVAPTISMMGSSIIINSIQAGGVSYKYTTDGTDPKTSGTTYSGAVTLAEGNYTVKAVACNTVNGTTYWSAVTESSVEILGVVTITSFAGITNARGNYKLGAGFTATGTPQTAGGDVIGTSTTPFRGAIDGDYQPFSLSQPLFDVVEDAVIKNVIVSNATVSGTGNVGAIVNNARGSTRIYNCGVQGGTVSGTAYVGSIVGLLDGTSRVINCFSYANVSGGTDVGGIVGYNNYASKSTDIRTMVMNCMFYGNATGTNISPVYGGKIINNSGNTGLNNFNYYSFEDFTSTVTAGKYNCALGAEERFLTRFEFYRQILNSNRELAAWYINGSTMDSRDVIAKWVLDKSVARYPILKPHSKYPSIINYDASAGSSLGTLSVTVIQGTNAPPSAAINTGSLTLSRTDKDPANFNFNYDKVQLPYYNDVGTGNCTDNKVVVGWEITAVTGGTAGSFATGIDVPAYNFADRHCTQKDLYGVTGRVFSQGAYYDVPDGVTAITICPHWATAAYLSDPKYDKTYSNSYAGYDIDAMGTRYVNNTNYLINGSSQKVYTTMGNAIAGLNRPDGSSVYDYAVVLVGNYQHYYGSSSIVNDTKGFTIMSADLDMDNEPDNCFIYQHGYDRNIVSPIRFDFLCWAGIGMAQKPSNSPRMPGIGIFRPNGWFEVTNTCIARFTELEYDYNSKTEAPLILMGGVVEQIVSKQGNSDATRRTSYIHLGSNVWFKMFNNGVHADQKLFTPHVPISVTGGEYEKFYLSGMFRPDANANADNAECYISGGRFGEVAGAGQEQVKGDVYWQIDYADIEDFYGGGINDAKPVTGNITTEISNSNVAMFCGGPKFGDMSSGKVVTTTATDCTFGRFFGAGYGGTSYNKVRKRNYTGAANYEFNGWATDANHGYKRQYETTTSSGGSNADPNENVTVNAISTNYEYELFAYAGFANDNNVGRFYVNYASLSLATTRSVTSTLTGCTVLENFYGGGNLGKVEGNVTSTLTDCRVLGNAYGAGFSATAPTVDVMAKTGFTVEPHYDGNSGTYMLGEFPATTTYTWTHTDNAIAVGSEFDETGHLIYTDVDMTALGTVTGKATLTIDGHSVIGTMSDGQPFGGTGKVFGGGEESKVGSTEVRILDRSKVLDNVYGGGNMGEVLGNTKVIVNGTGL
ncbi:MAG: chitobiase/beta-hexosaminidase C-terminal domain-containing protein [Bacteroidales bacterium]|nr:chitobiase/beta-hexosaminidase C-terminal domain-containing protein [Bacteroidales bacterium]